MDRFQVCSLYLKYDIILSILLCVCGFLVKYFKTNANAPILDSIIYCSVYSYFEKCILWVLISDIFHTNYFFYCYFVYLFLFMREALNFHFCLTVTISWETNWPWMMAITIFFSQLCNYAFYLCIILTYVSLLFILGYSFPSMSKYVKYWWKSGSVNF